MDSKYKVSISLTSLQEKYGDEQCIYSQGDEAVAVYFEGIRTLTGRMF